jgi:hypothetical protein
MGKKRAVRKGHAKARPESAQVGIPSGLLERIWERGRKKQRRKKMQGDGMAHWHEGRQIVSGGKVDAFHGTVRPTPIKKEKMGLPPEDQETEKQNGEPRTANRHTVVRSLWRRRAGNLHWIHQREENPPAIILGWCLLGVQSDTGVSCPVGSDAVIPATQDPSVHSSCTVTRISQHRNLISI